MAKTSGPSKSEIARQVFKDNPEAGPTKIAQLMAEKGHEASISLVIQALRPLKKGGKKRRGRPKGSTTKTSEGAATATRSAKTGGKSPAEHLYMAADFSKACGGVDKALEALTVLKKVTEKVK